MTITFNELRSIKDSLPHGSMERIAKKLEMNIDTVRNYFGATHFERGQSAGIHIVQGPNGGFVILDDDTILKEARYILTEMNN